MVFKAQDAIYVQITPQLPPFVVPLLQAPLGFFNDDAICTHVESFGKIFLQCDPKTLCEIEEKLDAFYQQGKNRKQLAMLENFEMNFETNFDAESLCVVMLRLPGFPFLFHRGIIRQRNVPSPGLNQIYLLDFGATAPVQTGAIFKSALFCFEYPAQAICCRLAKPLPLDQSVFMDIIQYNEKISVRFENRDDFFYEISIFIDDWNLMEFYQIEQQMILPKLGVTYERWMTKSATKFNETRSSNFLHENSAKNFFPVASNFFHFDRRSEIPQLEINESTLMRQQAGSSTMPACGTIMDQNWNESGDEKSQKFRSIFFNSSYLVTKRLSPSKTIKIYCLIIE